MVLFYSQNIKEIESVDFFGLPEVKKLLQILWSHSFSPDEMILSRTCFGGKGNRLNIGHNVAQSADGRRERGRQGVQMSRGLRSQRGRVIKPMYLWLPEFTRPERNASLFEASSGVPIRARMNRAKTVY